MSVYAFLALCFVPLAITFLLLVLVVHGLKIRYALWACVLGLLAVLPIAFAQYFAGKLAIFNQTTFAALLLTAIVFNGVIEETLKMLFMLLLPHKKLTVAAFFASALLFGLALGSFESVIYLVRRLPLVQQGISEAYKFIALRTVTAGIVHTFCAGLSGLGLWMARHKQRRLSPFVYAALLHGMYNFFAAFSSNFRYFSIVAILFAALECRIWYHWLCPSETGVRIKKTA